MKLIKYIIAILRVKITKDYGMCCDEQRAKECIREYYFGNGK